MELKIKVPDYLSIKHYKQISKMDHLSNLDKMIRTIGILTDLDRETVRQMDTFDLQTVFSTVSEQLINLKSEFYPIIEIEGQLFGYVPISKLTLGEYIDLENLNKDAINNLEQIMALLYRPIVKHKFYGVKWAVKSGYKLALDEAENLFKYYTVEKYTPELRKDNAKVMENFPASFAIGAMTFFLHNGNLLLLGSEISSDNKKQKMVQIKEMSQKMTSPDTGDGLRQFIVSRKVPSLRSLEITQLQM
jgi:hypothetical protein